MHTEEIPFSFEAANEFSYRTHLASFRSAAWAPASRSGNLRIPATTLFARLCAYTKLKDFLKSQLGIKVAARQYHRNKLGKARK